MNALEIVNLRKKFNITQVELAKLVGVSVRTIANYESGGVIPPATDKKLELLASKTCIEIGNVIHHGDGQQPHSDHLGRMLSIIEEQGKTFRETMARSQDEIDRLLAIIERQQQPLITTESSSKKHAG